ncbi:vomeronasal type-1 receptor 2-like [Echinops telfairi]|uniref:Vomeronasal type-1 receptor n=1 Tax=Echinops telfairi TaxID=9371 RepID=A0ABM1VKL1_ECHTE|nr:vomeronasal type-1 receptor 2-like [Echinops telfairi]
MDLKIPIIYMFEIVVGILGNLILIVHYFCLYIHGCRSRSTDLILRNLTVANSLVILSNGVPKTMAALGVKDFLNDFGCKLVLYIHRVARGVSIGSTCLLSVSQAITISPRNSRWAHVKQKALKHIGLSSIHCWVLHLLVSAVFPIYTSVKRSNKITMKRNDLGYCSFPNNDNTTLALFVSLVSCHDVVCLGLMAWASCSMVSILYRHQQQVRHIYTNNFSPRSSAERRASQNIIFLVSTFVSFYVLSSVIGTYLSLFDHPSQWLVNMYALLTACFPTASPFILMKSDTRVLSLCYVCSKRNA